jgi:hypothetical protein
MPRLFSFCRKRIRFQAAAVRRALAGGILPGNRSWRAMRALNLLDFVVIDRAGRLLMFALVPRNL